MCLCEPKTEGGSTREFRQAPLLSFRRKGIVSLQEVEEQVQQALLALKALDITLLWTLCSSSN